MNFNIPKRISALLAGLILTVGCGGSSTTTTPGTVPGTITGSVKDTQGNPIAGVAVVPSPAAVAGVTTDSAGKYQMMIPPGSYTLTFNGDAYEPATSASTPVDSNQTVTVDQTLAKSSLTVSIVTPPALKDGGPAGFGTADAPISVGPFTVTAKLSGNAVTPDSITWSVTEWDKISPPPTDPKLSSTTEPSVTFQIPDYESIREGANAWFNARYGLVQDADKVEYVPAPDRAQLLPLGTQQVRAMSYLLKATVKSGNHTTTGSVLVSPVTITNGGNTQPIGMMVVANAAKATTYSWSLEYLDTVNGTAYVPAADGLLKGGNTRNPYFVPTVPGVYKLTIGGSSLLVRASTYHGAGMSDTDEGADGVACASCHQTGLEKVLTTNFTEWQGSAHANHKWRDPLAAPMSLFQFGLTGGDGAGYTAACIGCHTVGYSKVPTANNHGFDDEAAARVNPDTQAADPWSFPTTLAPAAWDDVTKYSDLEASPRKNSALLHRAGIQCENCHGPLEPTDHSAVAVIGKGVVTPKASMDAGVCLVCHDSLTHHDRGSLWSASGHANLELAVEEGVSSTSCARCHSAEGFMLYLPRQQSGTPGNLADVSSLSAATIHSQTCQTCHDPHTTELRVSGDTKQTAGMFSVPNAGDGALCIICHNSRSGAIKQGAYAISSWSRLGPHQACQGDMFAGRNAFFITNLTATDSATTLPNLSAHAFMADTCADCHVKWVPPDIQAQYQPFNTNHTFRSSTKVCAECHSEDIGERIQESISDKMDTLNGRLNDIFTAKLLAPAGFDTAAGSRKNVGDLEGASLTDPSSRTVLPADVQGIKADPANGAIIVALKTGSQFEITLDKVYAVGTTTPLLDVTNATTQTVAKAYFNLIYVSHDGAKGIHNPSFAAKVLDNATAALVGVTLP